jgi:quercetin dioxygenase-like cupin family protein
VPKLFFASPRDLPVSEPQAGVRRRLVPADGATIAVSDLAPRTVIDTHKHEAEQVGLVTRGSLVLVIAGEQRILTPGDTYRVPPGTSHGARAFEEPVQIVAIWVPPLEEGARAAAAL